MEDINAFLVPMMNEAMMRVNLEIEVFVFDELLNLGPGPAATFASGEEDRDDTELGVIEERMDESGESFSSILNTDTEDDITRGFSFSEKVTDSEF